MKFMQNWAHDNRLFRNTALEKLGLKGGMRCAALNAPDGDPLPLWTARRMSKLMIRKELRQHWFAQRPDLSMSLVQRTYHDRSYPWQWPECDASSGLAARAV
jgi:hypothetical protein